MKFGHWLTGLILGIIIIHINCTIAFADSSAMGRKSGETVTPLNNTGIRMASENVKIKVLSDCKYFTTDCDFEFVNDTNETVSVLMGFPDGDSKVGAELPYLHKGQDMELKDFKAYINNTSLKVQREKGDKVLETNDDPDLNWPYWYTWNVNFKPHGTVYVRNTYKAELGSSIDEPVIYVGYVLETGKTWKDKIGYAKIEFDFSDIKETLVYNSTPKEEQFKDNKFIWEFKNFEPDASNAYINVGFLKVNDETVSKVLNRSLFDFCLGSNRYYSSTFGLQKINGSETYAAPYMKNGKIYVPLRFVGKFLNMEVAWDSSKNQAIIKQKRKIYISGNKKDIENGEQKIPIQIIVTPGRNKISTTNIYFFTQYDFTYQEYKKLINNKKDIIIEAAPEIIDNRLFVPIKDFLELENKDSCKIEIYNNRFVIIDRYFSDGYLDNDILINAVISRFKQLKNGERLFEKEF